MRISSSEGGGRGPDLVAQAQAAFAVWNEHGLAAFAERFWNPEIVWEEPPGFPDADLRRGRDACVRRMAERFELLGHVQIEVTAVTALDNVHLQELIVRGRGTASGVPTEMREYMLTTLDDRGRAVHVREFLDRDQALAALRED